MARARIRVEGGWRRSAGVFGGARCYSGCCERDGGIRRSRCSRTELVRVCGDVQLAGGQWRSCAVRQRSESSEGPLNVRPTLGQMQSEAARRRVSLPAMEKKRRRRVLVVTRTMRAANAITFGGEAARFTSWIVVARWSGSIPLPVGDEVSNGNRAWASRARRIGGALRMPASQAGQREIWESVKDMAISTSPVPAATGCLIASGCRLLGPLFWPIGDMNSEESICSSRG